MADITMCTGVNCPLKEQCYRYKAKPNKYWQPVFVDVPYKDNKCEHWVPVSKEMKYV